MRSFPCREVQRVSKGASLSQVLIQCVSRVWNPSGCIHCNILLDEGKFECCVISLYLCSPYGIMVLLSLGISLYDVKLVALLYGIFMYACVSLY